MRIPPSSFAILPINRGTSHNLPKPEPAQAQGAQKVAPPGLGRVLERLQSLFEPTAGQANASERISRNLARYAQTQAIGTAPPSAAANSQANTIDAGIKSNA